MSVFDHLPHPGNLHDPNGQVTVHWACGHTTTIAVAKLNQFGQKLEVVSERSTPQRCAQCVISHKPLPTKPDPWKSIGVSEP